MKSQMNTNLVVRSSLALALTLVIWSPVYAQSSDAAAGKTMTAATMMERCQEMKAAKQKLKEDTAAQDAQITVQLTEMNSAAKDKKVGLMAAILTRTVEQRITMDARKAKMEDEMMQHMMQHIQMGKDSMSQCPMMQGMKDMAGTASGAAKAKLPDQQ